VIRNTFRTLVAAIVFSGCCLGQSTPAQKPADAPCPASGQAADKTAKPCTAPASDAKKPSATEQFPFPGEAAKPATAPDAPGVNTPTPAGAHPSAASEHPFPSDADSSSSSSSSGSSSSDNADDPTAPAGPPLHDEGSEGTTTRRKLPKVKRVQTDDERVDEDLSVAKFYVNDGNLQGAYLRAKDAVKIQPDYSETHFVLGEVAQKMKKRDEAIAEFSTYLKLDPKGEKMKAAQKALAELQ
jgi:tetratricopeptide (TPR) repeat protein